jgi:hypothetical protein
MGGESGPTRQEVKEAIVEHVNTGAPLDLEIEVYFTNKENRPLELIREIGAAGMLSIRRNHTDTLKRYHRVCITAKEAMGIEDPEVYPPDPK